MDDIDPRAAKLLGDLLALALADNDAQAQTALAALRRRALAEGVSGGAMKQTIERVLGGLATSAHAALDEVHQLRWMMDDQRRELNETRAARQRAEMALARAERARVAMQAGAESADRGQRTGLLLAFLAGLAVAGVAAVGFVWLSRPGGTGQTMGPGPDTPAQERLAEDLHECFLASSNSLVGTRFAMRLQLEVNAAGHVIGVRWAPMQSAQVSDPGRRTYGDMVIRTLASDSCGALALPPSLRGRPGRIDVTLQP